MTTTLHVSADQEFGDTLRMSAGGADRGTASSNRGPGYPLPPAGGPALPGDTLGQPPTTTLSLPVREFGGTAPGSSSTPAPLMLTPAAVASGRFLVLPSSTSPASADGVGQALPIVVTLPANATPLGSQVGNLPMVPILLPGSAGNSSPIGTGNAPVTVEQSALPGGPVAEAPAQDVGPAVGESGSARVLVRLSGMPLVGPAAPTRPLQVLILAAQERGNETADASRLETPSASKAAQNLCQDHSFQREQLSDAMPETPSVDKGGAAVQMVQDLRAAPQLFQEEQAAAPSLLFSEPLEEIAVLARTPQKHSDSLCQTRLAVDLGGFVASCLVVASLHHFAVRRDDRTDPLRSPMTCG